MPTGRLRAGFAKVAGVVPERVYVALREFQQARGLPTLSRAVGAALTEWYEARHGEGVQNPEQTEAGQE